MLSYFYGVSTYLSDYELIQACATEEIARQIMEFAKEIGYTSSIVFDTKPIETRTVEYKPMKHYECDCGCQITVDGKHTFITRCERDDCCDPELCLAHPNLFITEVTYKK